MFFGIMGGGGGGGRRTLDEWHVCSKSALMYIIPPPAYCAPVSTTTKPSNMFYKHRKLLAFYVMKVKTINVNNSTNINKTKITE